MPWDLAFLGNQDLALILGSQLALSRTFGAPGCGVSGSGVWRFMLEV